MKLTHLRAKTKKSFFLSGCHLITLLDSFQHLKIVTIIVSAIVFDDFVSFRANTINRDIPMYEQRYSHILSPNIYLSLIIGKNKVFSIEN